MEGNFSSLSAAAADKSKPISSIPSVSRQQVSNNITSNNKTTNNSTSTHATTSSVVVNNSKRKINDRTIIGYIHIRQFDNQGFEVIHPYHKPIEQITLSNTSTNSNNSIIKIETVNGKQINTNNTTLIPCPLCRSNSSIGPTINHLWNHFYESHRDKYDFTVGLPEDGLVHIGVLEKRKNDIRYKCNPPEMEKDYTKAIRKNNTSYKPKRQYYHYGTLEKIHPHEYIMGIDCEEDRYMDRTWEHELRQDAIRDFVDITIAEYDFCTLWNRFLLNNPVMIRAELPSRFLEFATECANHVVELPAQLDSTDGSVESKDKYDKMIEQFTLFLLSRWDEGEVNRTQVDYILDLFNTLIEAKRNVAR